jgi:hypothetical protein
LVKVSCPMQNRSMRSTEAACKTIIIHFRHHNQSNSFFKRIAIR